MKSSQVVGFVVAWFVAVSLSPAANAALISFSDRTTFEAAGTITENYGFDDWPSGQINFPGDPYTAHGVTYTSSHNEILGAFSGNNNPSAWIANQNLTPLTGTISGTHNMFGFDLGVFGTDSLLDYTLVTNLGSYNFNDVVVPNLDTQLQTFFGYTAGAGEHFTGFSFSAQGVGSGPALDNVTLGTLAVPEPSTLALFGAGLAGIGAMRRRRKSRS